MLYDYFQIISIIFSFSSSGYELYRTVNNKNPKIESFILYGMRLISSSSSSIYYTLNNIDILIKLNIYKSCFIHCIVIMYKLYYYIINNSIQNNKDNIEENSTVDSTVVKDLIDNSVQNNKDNIEENSTVDSTVILIN